MQPPSTGGDGTVAGLGERALVAAVTARYPQGEGVLVGPGDDAAVVAAPDARVVVTTDVLVEGVHFRRDWSPAHDVGRKAAAQSLADVAAMGAVTTSLVVGLAAPADLPASWALELADGLREESALVGASVVGGDVVSSPVLTVAVTALGDLQGRAPLTRTGARPGDVVAVAGRLGWSAAGLAVLRRGFRSPRALVQAHRCPEPPYAAGPLAAALGATSLVDVSDGLVLDLGHVARGSGVDLLLRRDALEVPGPVRDAAAALGADPYAWLLAGGEDHALAGTFPAGAELGAAWTVLGEAAAAGEGGPRVLVDGAPWEGEAGYDHFG
ncbi:thiamine-phosphate kinase [Vallicoccus soli]|uniref:Thiamine-monophosphate kinase n=1 Tax=Vallicoccus soli TaxID=2339232 RepID=A0A3A3Z1U3_9ACTN|nr:thiamine-phosphate kinase [Vallicoccus soli]RJK98239.1 thiamine-phosphate kinase [Vallicoccus soli]